MDLSIYCPPVSNPSAPPGTPVTAFFKERLKKCPVVLIPENFSFSGIPSKALGEQAESVLCDMMKKCGQDIFGVQILCFHGIRVIGGSPSILREVDSCSFINYQGRYYVLIKEVKCNADSKTSNNHRKKAISQLNTFKEMLKTELGVTTDTVQQHVVWPNMPPSEPCLSCGGSHPALYEKPIACQQPGAPRRTNPEAAGVHIFNDKFVGDNFSAWIKSVITDVSKAVDVTVYNALLGFVARHCIGVLHDQTVGSFCVLGEDQTKLLARSEQPLTEPTVIYGLSGTGKTISIMARIQQISGNLSASSKAIYMCFEDNVMTMVKKKLQACQVDLTHITFANVCKSPIKLQDAVQDVKVIQTFIQQGFRFIYIDSAEDMGVDWVNSLMKSALAPSAVNRIQTLRSSISGDFWITVDPFQGLHDTHSLVKGKRSQIRWQGNLIKTDLLEEGCQRNQFVKLQECFRMPLTIINHIEEQKILPTKDLTRGQDVMSQGVLHENIPVPTNYSIQWLTKQVAGYLYKKVMLRGIHPGHCAILFHHEAMGDLFPSSEGGFSAFIQGANAELRGICVGRQAGHMLQMTEDVEESVLFGCHTTLSSTSASALVSFPVLSQVGSISPPEDTAEYRTEQHNEVTF